MRPNSLELDQQTIATFTYWGSLPQFSLKCRPFPTSSRCGFEHGKHRALKSFTMFHLKSSPLRSMWKIQDCSSGPVFMRGSDMVPRTGPAVQSRRTVRQSFIPERLRTSCCEGNAIGKVSCKTSDHRCKLLPSFSLRGVKLLPSRRQLCLHQLRGDFPRKWCGSDLSRPASHEGSSDFATRPAARLAGSFCLGLV